MRIVAVDVGGTHARFAWAEIVGGAVSLEAETVLKTSEFVGLAEAWRAFIGNRPSPEGAAIAIAAPVRAAEIKLTNNDWVFRRDTLAAELGVRHVHLVNDFAAVAHAVPACLEALLHLCGPDAPLPSPGVVTVVGPGTGLGVAQLIRRSGENIVIPCEGGHVGFAPSDAFEDRLLARLRDRHGRVSAERVVCGRGLAEIHAVLCGEDLDERTLWTRALAGDPHLSVTIDRYCGALGAVAGDLALAHGAAGVVIAGGLGAKLSALLPQSSFAQRFADKGRFAAQMAALPVKMITHPQPGLLGAAAAYAAAETGRAPLQG